MFFAAYELSVLPPHQRKATLERLCQRAGMPLLVLETCQRMECFGLNLPEPDAGTVQQIWQQAEAFERLVRIAAGLESRVLGELEILGQVRTAYKSFRENGGDKHSRLDRVFQDALSLAREARRESGIDRNLISLGALASRALMECVTPSEPVAVVGSGSLAGSVARYLAKRGNHPVRVASRCPENAMQLAQEVGGFAHGLDNLSHLFDGVKGIVTATAAPHALIYPPHLEKSHRPLIIIDLGVPADCHSSVAQLPGLTYITLEQVEERAQLNSADRRERGQRAAEIIREGAQAWARKHAA
jgi:glutamyl-tRNA reductase